MNIRSIFSEAWRNVATGTARAGTWCLALFVFMVIIAGSDVSAIVELQRGEQRWEASGASIKALHADHGDIAGDSCAQLSRTVGRNGGTPIAGSGALGGADTLTIRAMKAAPLDSFRVTPSLGAVLGIGSQRYDEGVWISKQLADTLNVSAKSTLETDRGSMRISAVFDWPQDSRDQRIAYAVLVPSSSQETYDECWANIVPDNADTADLVKMAAEAHINSRAPLQVKMLNNSFGPAYDGWTQFQTRSSRYLLLMVPVVAMLIGVVSVRLRRVEFADDLHCGLRKRDIWITNALETLMWSLPAALMAAACSYCVAARMSDGGNAKTLLLIEIPVLLAALLSVQLGVFAAMVPISGRRLFGYFRSR